MLGIGVHRAEFVKAKVAAVETYARLDEDRRPGGVKPDRDDDREPQRERRQQSEASKQYVEQAFERGFIWKRPVSCTSQPKR